MLYEEFEANLYPQGTGSCSVMDHAAMRKYDLFSLFNIVIAAGGFVRNEKDEILFIFRRGHWDLPKGKLNHKKGIIEKKKDAAVREVMEETGIEKIDIFAKKGPHLSHFL
ncbi:MAG: NUDIX domain-containing protein [Marinilabiliales bacterium]|nr:NUDIX domain-containing protein [Marinilabiliales bacterium]